MHKTTGEKKEKKLTKPKEQKSAESKKEDKKEVVVALDKNEIDKLCKKAEERDVFLEELRRIKADYINYQKRIKKEKQNLEDLVVRDFARRLLSVLDDFQRAIDAASENKDFDNFLEGVRLVQSQIYKVLNDEGITPIKAEGCAFDPSIHEAVTQIETDECKEGTVLEELQKGYLFKDVVIRPAKVKVSKRLQEKTCPENNQDAKTNKT